MKLRIMHTKPWLRAGILAAVLSILPGARADGPEGALAGHSLHGDAFNEGPRQKAYLMGGTGKVHFPITTAVPLAQKFFDQGIGQLHGFWYFEAERSFRQAAALDTNCATAFWGMAMANINNPKRAKDFIKIADDGKSRVSPREAVWIDSLAAFYRDEKKDEKERRRELVHGYEQLVKTNPKDIEAKAFLAFQIWDNGNKGIAITNRQSVETIIAQVMAAEPMHPAHHYRIHLWNDNNKDTNALVSAALCGQASPAIAHMWHMPGHTFSALKRYADAAWQQEASARADHAHMMHDHVLPDQIHNYAHNNEWLIRDLNHIGRVHDAVDLAKNMIELPRHPKYNTLTRGSSNYGRARLFETLLRYELWDEVIALSETIYLEPTDLEAEQVKRLRTLGVAFFGKGDAASGQLQITALETMVKPSSPPASPNPLAEKACDKTAAPNKYENTATNVPATRIALVEPALAELKCLAGLAHGNREAARQEFSKLKDLSKERQAQLQWQLGEPAKAEQLALEALKASPNQVQPLANYIDLAYRNGHFKEAFAQFYALRDQSAWLDLDAPICQRLQPVAHDLGFGKDWRSASRKPMDVGVRPPLNKLGPFRWQPTAAPEWALPGLDGKTILLKHFRGKPVVVIFYLGYGCSHCMEQLNAFAPLAKEYAAAGISLVAISTDTVAGLKQTFPKSKAEAGFPFPLVSDPSLNVFKSYRAFDDFEKMPLHGTYLVDGDGLVRWQDISYQPFTEPKFLLAESKRLLQQPRERLTGKPTRLAVRK